MTVRAYPCTGAVLATAATRREIGIKADGMVAISYGRSTITRRVRKVPLEVLPYLEKGCIWLPYSDMRLLEITEDGTAVSVEKSDEDYEIP